MRRGLTPSQTVGPFFHGGLLREGMNVLVRQDTEGQRIRLEGYVYDGDRAPVADAMVEIWQANAFGRYRHPLDQRPVPLDPGFVGFGRAGTDDAGFFWFETIKPGPVPFRGGVMQAPHINVAVSARGLLDCLWTRLYFDDDPATATDPVLRLVPEARRGTLLARRQPGTVPPVYRFDIVLQGDGETAFFVFEF
ncbi:MAG: protocatechuate 3,4-dioxygenase subunit alpha [Armatimonadota bacterium]|nr:protocatechuate 3,4-dioxygenase subunit alpha [Armatimonadota bacterium]